MLAMFETYKSAATALVVSVWSLQSDGFVSIGNAASYGCAAFGCSEFVCLPARAHSLHLSLCLFVSV